jgi:hypothetical protein
VLLGTSLSLIHPKNWFSFQNFAHQLNYKRDVNDLLLYCLKQLVNHRRYMNQCRRGVGVNGQQLVDQSIEIQESDLIDKV